MNVAVYPVPGAPRKGHDIQAGGNPVRKGVSRTTGNKPCAVIGNENRKAWEARLQG